MKSIRAYLVAAAVVIIASPVTITHADEPPLGDPPLVNEDPSNYGVSLTLPSYVVVNDDDDQPPSHPDYEKWDMDHCPSAYEDDLQEVKISATAGKVGGYLTLRILKGQEKITSVVNGTVFWADSWKYTAGTIPDALWLPAGTSYEATYWIEGNHNSDAFDDVHMQADFYTLGGQGSDGEYYLPVSSTSEVKKTTVVQADIDVDSNNNEGTEFTPGSDEEDKIEASVKPDGVWTKRPGKIIMVNDGFGDDIPDWADGFKSDTSNSSTDTCGDPIRFIPILLERKVPFTEKCKVVFKYPASDPNGVATRDDSGFPNYDKIFTKPAGKIRIWKKNNDGTTRKKGSVKDGGDYVPVNDAAPIEIDWVDLSDTNVAHLFVEAVEASAELADIDVSAEISENGARTVDNIKFTAIKITCEPINSGVISGDPVNPSGLVAGSTSKFQISVEPAEYPDGAIEWASDLPGGSFSAVPSTDSNRNVNYTPSGLPLDAYGLIWAKIKGNYYGSPGFGIKVFKQWKIVKISTYIIGDASGNLAWNTENVTPLIDGIQEIYNQAGIKFEQGPTELLAGGEYAKYYYLLESDKRSLTNYATNTGGLELYLVKSYAYPGEDVVGRDLLDKGIICRTNDAAGDMLAVNAAHEIGHSCGLQDIYEVKNGIGAFEREKAKSIWAQYDWPAYVGFNSDPSYYSRLKSGYDCHVPGTDYRQLCEEYAMRHEYLIDKLMMYGDRAYVPEDARDLPIGEIYGVYIVYNIDLGSLTTFKGNAKVGLQDMIRNPIHY